MTPKAKNEAAREYVIRRVGAETVGSKFDRPRTGRQEGEAEKTNGKDQTGSRQLASLGRLAGAVDNEAYPTAVLLFYTVELTRRR